MKVKELIEELLKQDQEQEVFVGSHDVYPNCIVKQFDQRDQNGFQTGKKGVSITPGHTQ